MNTRRAFAIAIILTAAACGNEVANDPDDPMVEPTTTEDRLRSGDPATYEELERAMNASLNSSIEVLRASGSDNGLISPASLAYALAMAGEGAQCETETEINAFLGVDDDRRATVYSDLISSVGHKRGNAVTSLDGAIAHNEKNDTIKLDLVQDVANTYDSMFLSDTVENLNPALNDWVDESTGGLQTEIPSPLKDTTALSFLSAMRYETAWEGEALNSTIDFTTLSGEKVTVDGYKIDEKTTGWEVDGGTIIELPTQSRDATYVFYPDDTIDPNELTIEDWNTDDARSFDVFVTLPAVDFESRTDLIAIKGAIGLEHLTDNEKGCGLADYSVTENVFISLVLQNTTLRIDDNGIAASAVTQIDAVDGAAPGQEAARNNITVDRPYALMTTSGSSGWALMYATITDPSTAIN